MVTRPAHGHQSRRDSLAVLAMPKPTRLTAMPIFRLNPNRREPSCLLPATRKGLVFLDMQRNVILLGQAEKVIDGVVASIPVDVMYVPSIWDWPALLFPHMTMRQLLVRAVTVVACPIVTAEPHAM